MEAMVPNGPVQRCPPRPLSVAAELRASQLEGGPGFDVAVDVFSPFPIPSLVVSFPWSPSLALIPSFPLPKAAPAGSTPNWPTPTSPRD